MKRPYHPKGQRQRGAAHVPRPWHPPVVAPSTRMWSDTHDQKQVATLRARIPTKRFRNWSRLTRVISAHHDTGSSYDLGCIARVDQRPARVVLMGGVSTATVAHAVVWRNSVVWSTGGNTALWLA